ncbi:MAG: helix-turn-helix domain-containing protein [Alphaproteobacteria bacterium]
MNTEVCKDLGKSIANRRQKLNMTQEALALHVELSVRSIQRIEAGKDQQPPYETLFKIALALDTDPCLLILPMWTRWLEDQSV